MIQLKHILWTGLFLTVFGTVAVAQQAVSRFREPELLKTNDGKAIVVETGSCAPFMRDINGDGRADLLVGEFGDIVCPEYENRYVQGRCRVFCDVKREGKPELLPYRWLESGGEPLYVPITCCIPMSPAFADVDGDGQEDLISGSYPGEMYWWPALTGGSWGDRQLLVDEQGKAINPGKAVTVFAVDMNGNGVMDLLVNGLYDGLFWIENAAGKDEKARYRLHANRLKTKAGTELEGSYAILEDLDGDGHADLLVGNREGGIYWCRYTSGGWEEPECIIASTVDKKVLLVGEALKGPGQAPRFCMYDWDGDGKKDLIVCTEMRMQQQRHLSAEETAKKAVLQKEYHRKSHAWGKLREKAVKIKGVDYFYIGSAPYDRLPKRLADKIRPLDLECLRLADELRPYDEFYFRNTGHVWIYYRK